MSHVQIVPLCPSKVPIRRPSSDRQRLADRSFAQLMRRSPSRLNLTAKALCLAAGAAGRHALSQCREVVHACLDASGVSADARHEQQYVCTGVMGVERALDLCQWPLMAFEQVGPHRGGGPQRSCCCSAILWFASRVWAAAAPLRCSAFLGGQWTQLGSNANVMVSPTYDRNVKSAFVHARLSAHASR